MKVLVDTGVISNSYFLVGDSQERQLRWGKTIWRRMVTPRAIAGFRRVEIDRDSEQQLEKDALFTIGRLARAGRIKLYTYNELAFEIWRRPRGREPLGNALDQCKFHHCPAAIERSKFRSTSNLMQWARKGGRADRARGLRPSEFNQIAYFEWLCSLSTTEKDTLISCSTTLHLDDFEVLSLQDLPWFQTLARALVSPENLPDCFHIWTARRNKLDAFLTLEKKLPRAIDQLRSRRQGAIDVGVAVLRPTELLQMLNIAESDPVPIDPDRFYTFMEINLIWDRLLED